MVPGKIRPRPGPTPASLVPSGQYFRVDDRIVVKVTNPFDTHSTIPTIQVTWTILKDNGDLTDGAIKLRAAGASSPTLAMSDGVGPGTLQTMYVQIISNEQFEGQCRVEVSIQAGATLDVTKIFGQILYGYVSNSFPLSYSKNYYPGDFISESGQYLGSVPLPIAFPFVFNVSSGNLLRFHSFQVVVVTSAAAGNRFLHVDYSVGGNVYHSVMSKISQGPGLTTTYNIGGIDDTPGAAIINGTVSMKMLPVVVPSGGRVTIDATNKDAGDTVAVVQFSEWFQL